MYLFHVWFLFFFFWPDISEVCPLSISSIYDYSIYFHCQIVFPYIEIWHYVYPITIWIISFFVVLFFLLSWKWCYDYCNYFYTNFYMVKFKLDFGKINKDYNAKTIFKMRNVYDKVWFVQLFINGLDVILVTMKLTQTFLLAMQLCE